MTWGRGLESVMKRRSLESGESWWDKIWEMEESREKNLYIARHNCPHGDTETQTQDPNTD